MARRFVLVFLAACAAFSLVVAFYFARPQPFFFQAWEFFSLFVYEGYAERSQVFRESGDSARRYLFQRHVSENRVSVNALGNRTACYEDRLERRPRVLLIGDSQLFGSGTGDEGVFSSHLCRRYPAAVYNGARRHGLDLLAHPEWKFDAILFTLTERNTVAGRCDPGFEKAVAGAASRRTAASYLLPAAGERRPWLEQFQAGLKHLHGFLSGRFKAFALGRWFPPERHLDIAAPHRVSRPDAVARNVECARRMAAHFGAQGIPIGFLVFPAHQTIYPAELGLQVDPATLGFIDELSRALDEAGIRSLNSRQCLAEASRRVGVYHPHDSHLNGAGFGALAACLAQSRLDELFRGPVLPLPAP